MLPQRNATLVAVNASAGGHADAAFDTGSSGAGAGPEKWAGAVPAYYQEKRDRVQTAEGVDRQLVRSLIVENATVPVAIATGDVVTFDADAAGDGLSGVVRVVERRGARGVPTHVQTTRLTLEVEA